MTKFAFAAILIMTTAAAPVLAEDGNWPIGHDQIHVVDHTLDTRTGAGRAALLARVDRAAQRLCRDVTPQIDFKACVAETVRRTARDTAATRGGQALALAMIERDGVRLAGR